MDQPIFTFKTISNESEAEYKDRGSRFIAYAFPVRNVEEVKVKIKGVKEQHPKAVHHCFAWRLGVDHNLYRSSDDGEPSGSAGKPILGQLDSLGLTQVLVVVVRYFGGVLLGVPGLIHAYKTATFLAMEKNSIIEKNIELPYVVEFDYTQMNEVMRIVKQFNLQLVHQELQLFCKFDVLIPLAHLEATLSKFNDLREIKIDRKL